MLIRQSNMSPSKKPFVTNMKKVKRLCLIDGPQYDTFNNISEKDDYNGETTQEQNESYAQQIYGNQETTNESKSGSFRSGYSFANTMSNDELNDHIQKCLEMSSENKITPKNAFALQLIDCMNFLLNKKDFSTMACTLDAGAKIYSNRVDALHHQVLKLADEVILNQTNLTIIGNRKDGDIHSDETAKENRKARKRIAIASPKSLRKNLKGHDPRDKFIKVDGLPGAIISACKRKADDLSITLENNILFWENLDQIDPLNADGIVTLPEYKIIRNEKSEISKLYTNTNNNNNSNEINIERHLEVLSQDSGMNSLILESGNCEDIDNQSETNSMCEVHVISTAMKKINEDEDNKGIMEKSTSRFDAMKLIFHKSSEYHYLDMKSSQFWAGPEFWKRTKTSVNTTEKRVIRKNKQQGEIDYSCVKEEHNKFLKKCTILTKRTIAGWKRKKFTLPRDLKFDMQLFLDLFSISVINNDNLNLSNSLKSSKMVTNEENNNDLIQNQERVKVGSQNGLMSCFHDDVYEDHDVSLDANDTLNSSFYDENIIRIPEACRQLNNEIDTGKVIKVEIGQTGSPTLCESLLVPAPKTVRFEPIKYSSRPIRIDMQHLKNTMLDIIKNDIYNDGKEKQIWSDNSLPEAKFGNIYKKLPERLEKRTAEDLTPSMAIMALLTLANENQLNLVNDDFDDVIVRLDDHTLLA